VKQTHCRAHGVDVNAAAVELDEIVEVTVEEGERADS